MSHLPPWSQPLMLIGNIFWVNFVSCSLFGLESVSRFTSLNVLCLFRAFLRNIYLIDFCFSIPQNQDVSNFKLLCQCIFTASLLPIAQLNRNATNNIICTLPCLQNPSRFLFFVGTTSIYELLCVCLCVCNSVFL